MHENRETSLSSSGFFKRIVVLAVSQFRRLVAGFPQRRPVFEPKSGHVGFVGDKVALGQVCSEYFEFH
jgi:hypothetical protein